jgi:hypothetical protein
MKPVDISRSKRKNIRKLKLMNLKVTLRSTTSKTCAGVSVTLRVTGLDLI